jgi:hypothetical protein
VRDGRIVGAFRDGKIRIWNPMKDYRVDDVPEGHLYQITNIIQLREGILASIS